MHVMFIHPNFPGQFGHLAMYLSTQLRWPCTFVTAADTTQLQLPFNHINYRVGPAAKGAVTPDNLQGMLEHLGAVYVGLRGVPQIQPDLVVGHMTYGTMLYLRNLYNCPFIGYYELLPPPFWGEGMVLRKEFPPPEAARLFNATYHTLTYLHLHAVDACWTPTHFQKAAAPAEMRHKIHVISDGIDCDFFQPRKVERPCEFRGLTIGPDTKVVTFASRGLESVRGFDVFMKAAKKIARQIPDVLFLIAGDERTNYGHELHHIGGQSFKQWVLSQDEYDPGKFQFLGLIPPSDLATLYNLSDVHIYLTVPYVLSWSLMQGLASGCAVVGSATPPVQEVIEDGRHGLLADFYDADGIAERAVRLLRDQEGRRALGSAARALVLEKYERKHCAGELVKLFQGHARRGADDFFASLGGEGMS
jgi:glycosyltransferase involved in cell wall biosynthesis